VLLILSIIKAVCEILALALVGQGILWLVAGKSRDTNFVYKMFASVTRPVMWLARVIMPRIVLDRHIWMVAVFIVFALWVIAGQQKLKHCVTVSPENPLCVELVKALKERGGVKK
jgi:hypothetical protein